MSEEREIPASRAAETPETPANLGAPVEETAASKTEVLEAVERATSPSGETTPLGVDGSGSDASADAGAKNDPAPSNDDTANANASATSVDGAATAVDPGVAPTPELAEQERRQAISEVDTQLNIDTGTVSVDPTLNLDDMPSAAPERDGEIRISSDHPMAALYMQSPVPPELKGNRGAGVLIGLVATIGFALVVAGAVALWLAPTLAPSQFIDGLITPLMSWGYIAAVAAFLLGIIVLVLIVGRAGWWAYVLGGFFVGLIVWVGATIGVAIDDIGMRGLFERAPIYIVSHYGLTVPAIVAAVIAREVTVWFGAWIGARGRRMKLRNSEALAEYEAALAEVQTKRP